MKLLVLTAIIAAVSTTQLSGDQQVNQHSPWQVGKLYRYEVRGHTLAHLHEGASSGSAFQARFIIRVQSPNHLLAKLENPQHAQVHQYLVDRVLPEDLTYEPVLNMDKPFEIVLDGGRVVSLNLPSSLSLPYENILKGIIGALQVDLSTYRNIAGSPDNYDHQLQQGLFRKMETDVTGDCETLYSVSPVASEWRRELPHFVHSEEDPIEITKSKNYGHCHYRVDYHFGVPDVSEWKGTAKPEKEQFIRRATVSRILASKQGHIYKTETTSTVNVHPHMYGKQKAEVYSNLVLALVGLEEDKESEWQKPEATRLVKSLLYSLTTKQVAYHDRSGSSAESSSHSLEHVHEPQMQTVRKPRSVSPKLAAINNYKVGRPVSRLSSSSDSRSDSSAAYVNDEIPSINEPAYAALYMSPQSHVVKKQNIMNVQKLLQDIAQQLQNPNNMPKADFLSKFTILVRTISVMDTEQLTQTSRSIEVAKSSNNIVKADMWMIYRDAVVQAGTLPAFQQIKTWIQSKKIQGEEAAQVVATLATTLRYPTKEVMKQFFELALSPEVREQRFLNTSALIAATRFINMGHVDNTTVHSYYPTHMYGRLARKHDSFVLDEVLPRLTEELQKAIELKDSSQAQVYIRAIGNLGHREILRVFTPYLEGKIETSTFLRVQMLRNLQMVAKCQDKQVRAVCYSILKNTAEPYEVRIAAIHNVFIATPTTPMMLAMAQMTHEDPSVEVRAVLKLGIESAAQLTIPRYIELARTAEAARPMLTKENFSYLNSIKNLYDFYDNEYEVGIFSSFLQIGSDDSIIPKLFKYSLGTKNADWKSLNTIEGSWSSVQDFVDFWKATMMHNSHKHNSEHKFSAEKISEMLNIKRHQKRPLEASFYINLANQERLFTFDESDLKQLPIDIQHYMSEVSSNGVDKHYTKVLNQAYVSIMLPLVSGLPFLFKYREPTVIHIHSKAKGDMEFSLKDKDFKSVMDKEIKFTFARNLDGSVGFLDTITNQYSSVGVVNKLQVNIPIKMNIQLQKKQLKLRFEPIVPDQDITTFHYSVWPYSASQKKDTLVTVAQDPSTKVIERPRKTIAYDTKVGQKLGLLFHFQGYSYSNDYRNFEKMFMSRDWFANIVDLWGQRDIALTHMNLRFLVKQSQNKVVTLNAVFDSLYNQKQSGEVGEPTEMKDVTPNSEARRQEIMKRVASGINSARVQVLDLSAVFEGPQKVEYVLTAALADSPVDTLIQYVAFAGKNAQQGNYQVNAVGVLKKPEVSLMNFQEALKKEIKALFKTYVKYGKDSVIELEAQVQRNQRYTEELEKMPLGKVCAQQIGEGNLYQHACHKMIIMANAPNALQLTVTYKNIDSQVMNMSYHLYEMVRHFGYWNAEMNPMKRTAEGKIEIDADVDYIQNILQWSMVSKYGRIQMEDVPIPRWSAGALAVYTPFSAYERVQNYYTRHQFQPYCSVDGSKIRTFSNRSYDYTLSPSWHVVVQDEARERGNWHDLVILARRPQPKQQEIYISYQSENGKVLEIEIQPSTPQKYNVHVTTNGNKVSEGDLTMYWNELTDRPLLTYFTQQDGVLVLFIEDRRLRIMLDGERLVVLANDHRGTARGICGQMTGEPRDDYETPVGLVDQPALYGASFALDVDNSDPKTMELQKKAKELAYQPKHKYTAILRSDDEWRSIMQARSLHYAKGETVYRSIPWKTFPTCTIQQQTQFYETSTEICVSINPLPVCPSNCRAINYVVVPTEVTCGNKMDQHFRAYVDEIREGNNPRIEVPTYYQSELRQFRVPIECSE